MDLARRRQVRMSRLAETTARSPPAPITRHATGPRTRRFPDRPRPAPAP